MYILGGSTADGELIFKNFNTVSKLDFVEHLKWEIDENSSLDIVK